MIYMLPIFIFVILVALGADYNIFLVSRIREEAVRLPIREAVSRAVANTGGVITACGIILAGTFATLMTSPLQLVFQVGAAIAIGVLIDTFVVRALLVPCITTLTGRWSWWPSRLSRKLTKGS
jgi:RND superfamily putative drug exporter